MKENLVYKGDHGVRVVLEPDSCVFSSKYLRVYLDDKQMAGYDRMDLHSYARAIAFAHGLECAFDEIKEGGIVL